MAEHAPTNRVINILRFLAKERRGCTLSVIARGIGSPVSTCAIILRTLSNTGFLDYEAGTRRYYLGFGIFAVSSAYLGLGRKDLFRAAIGEMHRVVDTAGEICQLGVLRGGSVLFLAKVEPFDPIRTVTQAGVSMPACCTAAGKALLFDATLPRLRELYGRKLPSLTPYSLTSFEELLSQTQAVREGGFARNFRESTSEAVAYALPVRFHGRVVAGLSVSVPLCRASSEKEAQIEAELRKAQRRLEVLMNTRCEDMTIGRWSAVLPFVPEEED